MKKAGIVCEFNPFTQGHEYLISEARRAGAETVVCLMSGLFVQRGEPAFLPPSFRAAAAVGRGADAVFLLPPPFSFAGAGYFASAGVGILARLGCDAVVFGSETGDIESLRSLSVNRDAGRGHSADGIAETFFDGAAAGPNDILAAEYIRAAAAYPGLETVAVKRIGGGYCDTGSNNGYPSAAQVRRELSKLLKARAGEAGDDRGAGLPHSPGQAAFAGPPGETTFAEFPEGESSAEKVYGIPRESFGQIAKACSEGLCPADSDKAGELIRAAWRMGDADRLSACAECGGGLSAHLKRATLRSSDNASFEASVSTKKYTRSRIRRAMLCGALGIPAAALSSEPAYTRLLAANAGGRRFAGEAQAAGKIGVVTRVSDIPDSPGAKLQFDCECRTSAFYSMLLPRPLPADFFIKQPPVITQ